MIGKIQKNEKEFLKRVSERSATDIDTVTLVYDAIAAIINHEIRKRKFVNIPRVAHLVRSGKKCYGSLYTRLSKEDKKECYLNRKRKCLSTGSMKRPWELPTEVLRLHPTLISALSAVAGRKFMAGYWCATTVVQSRSRQ